MATIDLQGVTKRFGDFAAVRQVSLRVGDGEFVALLGPSGCGKTTIVRLIAGFERVSDGQIAFNDQVISSRSRHLPAERRRVGMVFQSYALWPHMDVARNVGYPLRAAGVRGADYDRRVAAALALVGLSDHRRHRPAQLSGGQQQRVALARCLVMEPSLVLLDEPLANLDVNLRAAMEEEFVAFHRKTAATMLYITHDQDEAMAMADRIAVMDRGALAQVDPPRRLYREPLNAMVAGFIGKSAVVDARVVGSVNGGRCLVEIFGRELALRCRPAQVPGPVKVCLRPEDLVPDGAGISARVRKATYKGSYSEVEVTPDVAPDARLLLFLEQTPRASGAMSLTLRDGWVIPEP